jgi:CRP/FNR family transcriptional regulator, dissimilatory nitrate respiration regulator
MKVMDTADSRIEELRAAYLFAEVPEEHLRALLAEAREIELAAGTLLFTQGERAEHFFFVRAGAIKLYRVSPNGGEKIIEIIRHRQTFAEAVTFLGTAGRYPVNAEAVQQSRLIAFSQKPFRELLATSPDTCFGLLASMSRRLHMLVNQIESLTLQNATYRLVSHLLEQIPPGVQTSPEIVLTTPKSTIAAHLAIQPETLSRILKRLVREGLIEVDGSHITLRDVEALRRAVQRG